jgi:hypothetical protein
MRICQAGVSMLAVAAATTLLLGCSAADQAPDSESLRSAQSALTAQDRLATCSQDPRVLAGLLSPDICAGGDIFLRETFAGNGRTCGSCHPIANNTTIDVPFLTALHASNPNDPLFIFERDPNLAQLETGDLLNAAAVLENVDGFQDPTQQFVSRSVNHMLSLRTSILRDSGDGTASPPIERTGWGGDGAPGDGTLRSFLTGAIKQHFTKDLARREGIDFRLPTSLELDLVNAFQLSLGRQSELDLTRVRINDADAEDGRQAFLDPQRGRCNVCHSNAGANFIDTRLNRNFNTGLTRVVGNLDQGLTEGTQDGHVFTDGGFGSTTPFDAIGIGFDNAYGDGSFSVPPLIEAADTGPFFHNNARGPDIENAVAFYASAPFAFSPAAVALEARFGSPLNLGAQDSFHIARFLRVLNSAFNLDIASQRLSAASTLVGRFGNTRADIQTALLDLAREELNDALAVLSFQSGLYTSAQSNINQANVQIAAGIAATTASARQSRINSALTSVRSARGQFGSNIVFQMGQGNLMF